MSKSALLFMLVALTSLAIAMLLPPEAALASEAMGVVAAVGAVLFVLALVKGRRIKFDPLLR